MHTFYIDESGSITNNHADKFPYFVVALIKVLDKEKLKKKYKKFVSSRYSRLKAQDKDNKMFDKEGRFVELKGCCFDPSQKIDFVEYFTKEKLFEVYYIKLVNSRIDESLCKNKARCFNYLIKMALKYYYEHDILDDQGSSLQIDERNIRTETKYLLEEYLNTELLCNGVVSEEMQVEYFESSSNKLIQIADVFSNLYYSHLLTGNYQKQIDEMKRKNILRHEFVFPIH